MIGSKIQWTDDTVNVVEGCTEVDTDCEHCYAKGIAARFSAPGQKEQSGEEHVAGHYHGLAKRSTARGLPQWTGKVRCRLDVLDKMFWRLLRAKEPRRQFLCSMGDIFHREVPDAFLDEVFARIAILEGRRSGPTHPFLLLTKRPDRAAEYTNNPEVFSRISKAAWYIITTANWRRYPTALTGFTMPSWPLRSVVLITSAGTQEGADKRVLDLLRAKAAHYGVSCEPMTGPVDFTRLRSPAGTWNALKPSRAPYALDARQIDWIILGGESGHAARPCAVRWMESVICSASTAGTRIYVKQLGNVLAAELGRPGKGGELEDLPESIRIREHVEIGP